MLCIHYRHQDNGAIRKFQDLHPDTGFEDYILYESANALLRWLQVYDPVTKTTCNLMLPSGALVTFTGQGNRRLFHCVPKDTRENLGERITIVARQMITYYVWETRRVIRDKCVKVWVLGFCSRFSIAMSCRNRRVESAKLLAAGKSRQSKNTNRTATPVMPTQRWLMRKTRDCLCGAFLAN